jgi:glycosyltransferase involved in cell wall biosynthesis
VEADIQRCMNTLLVLPLEGRGGVVTVVEDLAQYLREHGHHVVLLHAGRTVLLRSRTTPHGYQAYWLRFCFPFAAPRPVISSIAFVLFFPFILLQLLWLIRRHHIQIVNIHFPIDNLFYLALCRRLLPIRLVTSVHGSDAFPGGDPRRAYSRAFRFLLRASDLIVLPSDAYRKKIVQIFPDLGQKAIFIHNGVNAWRFGSGPLDDDGARKRQRDILCIAYLMEVKGVDLLIRAVPAVFATDETLRLVLVGEGPQRGELERLASALGIQERTEFLGSQQPDAVARLLQRCEVLAVPSRAESFGIVVIEAMASRKPVVAAAVGGIPEIIEHEVSGLLVEPENPQALANGLQRVLTNDSLRKTLADNGYTRVVEHFAFARTGASYERAFGTLLAAA